MNGLSLKKTLNQKKRIFTAHTGWSKNLDPKGGAIRVLLKVSLKVTVFYDVWRYQKDVIVIFLKF